MCRSLVATARGEGIYRFVVGAVIFHPLDKTVLIISRQPNDFLGGIEELPSGKVDGEETLFEALIREVKEEAGLDITVIDFLDYFDYSSKSGKRTRQFNFIAKTQSTDVRLNPEEHDNFRWIDKEDLDASKITDPVKKAILLAFGKH